MRLRVALASLLLSCTSHQADAGDAGSVEPAWVGKPDMFERATPDDAWVACARDLCRGGVVRIHASVDGRYGRWIAQFERSWLHPNAEPRAILSIGETVAPLELERTYAVIAIDRIFPPNSDLLLVEEDTAAGRAKVRAILESPGFFQNDEQWQRRRALWHRFRHDHPLAPPTGYDSAVRVWGEDDEGRLLAFIPHDGELTLFDGDRGSVQVVRGAVALGNIDRIEYRDRAFVLYEVDRRLGRVSLIWDPHGERNTVFVADPGPGDDPTSAAIRVAMESRKEYEHWTPPTTMLEAVGSQFDGGPHNRVTLHPVPGYDGVALAVWHDDEIGTVAIY